MHFQGKEHIHYIHAQKTGTCKKGLDNLHLPLLRFSTAPSCFLPVREGKKLHFKLPVQSSFQCLCLHIIHTLPYAETSNCLYKKRVEQTGDRGLT